MDETTVISDVARDYLTLHLTENVGPVTLRRLLEHFGSARAVLEASMDELRQVRGLRRTIPDAIREAVRSDRVDREIDEAHEHGVHILCPEDAAYPPLLKHTPDGPICLYVKGTLEPEDAVGLGIVGSRKPTHLGEKYARQFAQALAEVGMTIDSGMAYGVDACAHEATLEVGKRTIAVLGNGLSTIYPPAHTELAERIAAGGAVVSELPMATVPEASNFPRRNRIIAGMTLGTLVVEGGVRSGAMITARCANDYNREVFAIPGSPDALLSRGPNTLIRESIARLVMSTADVLDELGEVGRHLAEQGAEREPTGPAEQKHFTFTPDLSDVERQVLSTLGLDPVPMEMIVDATGLSAAATASTLTMLQLKRVVKQLPGGLFVPLHRA